MGMKKGPDSVQKLMHAIEHGLPRHALDAVLSYLTDDPRASRGALLGKVVSLATYKRRKLLKPDEGEKVARLAGLIAYARFVWDGNDAEVRGFFLTPHALLDHRSPLDLAFSELGARRVEELLNNIVHGLPA